MIDSSSPNINDIATNNDLIPLDQQQREAKKLATQLHKRRFIDTGCLPHKCNQYQKGTITSISYVLLPGTI